MLTSATNLGELTMRKNCSAPLLERIFASLFRTQGRTDEATAKRKSNLSDESAKVPSRELELLFQLLIRQSVHQGKFAREKKN